MTFLDLDLKYSLIMDFYGSRAAYTIQVVVNVCTMKGGDAFNVVPDTVRSQVHGEFP